MLENGFPVKASNPPRRALTPTQAVTIGYTWEGRYLVEQVKILEGAEGFVLGDGPVGALLIHGFTGSPQSLRGLGTHLANHGIAVEGPLLAGHGTTWEDLNRRTADEWLEAVDTAVHKMALERDEVFLVGLSFGATLALDFAARYPDTIAGLVTLAGFIHTKDPRRFLAPVIRRLVASLPGVSNDIADPEGREVAYDRLPTSAAQHMLRTVKRARVALPSVTSPILVMHGRNDHTVLPHNAQLIYDSVSSSDKELVWLERSYHLVTLDYDRDEVKQRTHGFIKAHSKVL